MIKDQINIEIAMSTTLNANVIEEIVRKQVEEQTGRKIVKITTNYDSSMFEGYHITFAPETPEVTAYKSSKEFIEKQWR
jgi:hypothetical protein